MRKAYLDIGVDPEELAAALPEPGDDYVVFTREWVGQLLSALDWRWAFGVDLPSREHINLSEYRALRLGVRRLMREGQFGSRMLFVTDSNVVLGAVAKGRSRSAKLIKLQQQLVSEMLFANIYIGVLPAASKDNPADAPSRCQPLQNSTALASERSVPAWSRRFVDGDLEAIDPFLRGYTERGERWLFRERVGEGPARARSEWTLSAQIWNEQRLQDAACFDFAACPRAAISNPEHHMRPAKDSGLGPQSSACEAGDGPPKKKEKKKKRDTSVDLRVQTQTQGRAGKLSKLRRELGEFGADRRVDLDALMSGTDVRPVVALLRDWGQHLYDNGRSRSDYSESINAIWHERDDWRAQLSGAWAVDRRWHQREPTEHTSPLLRVLLKAMTVWALLRGHLRFCLVKLLGFAGGLRPGDMYGLRRRSILFLENVCYVIFSSELGDDDPKTATSGLGRAQHVVIDDPLLVRFARFVLQNDSEDEPIGPSEYRFKRLWEQCLTFFQVSAHSDDGFTPGSLRAGCATALYLDGVPLDDIRWLLRHTSQKQLESYIQELPLAMNRVRHAAAAPQVEAHAALFDVALKAAIMGRLPTVRAT